MEIVKFNPTIAEIKATILEVEGLTIAGVEDVTGYELVKAGRTKVGKLRTRVTNFGKEQRAEAIAWQKEVLRQEKDLLKMIEPVENELKAKLEAIDAQVKRAEREALLPSRRAMLESINIEITDDEILDMDVDQFSKFYTEKQMAHFQLEEERKKRVEMEKKHAEELENAKKEAAENAKREAEEKAERDKQIAAEKAEKDKQDAIDKIKRDQEEKERKEKQAREKAIKDEEDRIENERKEQEKSEKNKKYKEWLAENGYNKATENDFVVKIGEPIIPGGKKICILFKKVSEITI